MSTGNKKKFLGLIEFYSITYEAILSLVASLIIMGYGILFFPTLLGLYLPPLIDSVMQFSLFGLGFFVTCLTIFYMFNPKDNPVFNYLKKQGLYDQPFKRFYDAIKIFFITFIAGILILKPLAMLNSLPEHFLDKILIQVFDFSIHYGDIVMLLTIFFTIWCLLRVKTCLNILVLMGEAVGNTGTKVYE